MCSASRTAGTRSRRLMKKPLAAGGGVLPDHGVTEELPLGGIVRSDVVVLFGGLENGGVDAAHQLVSVGDDAIFRVLVMPLRRRLDIEADTQHKQ